MPWKGFRSSFKDGRDDRDDGRGGDESEGKLNDPLSGLPIFNEFFVKFLSVGDGFFDVFGEAIEPIENLLLKVLV